GQVMRIPVEMRGRLLRMLLGVAEGRSDDAADAALSISQATDAFDERRFRTRTTELVLHYLDARLSQIQIGRVVLDLARLSAEAGVRMPREATMLGKTLLHLDQVGRTLDPHFDPNATVRSEAAALLRQNVWESLAPGQLI